MAASPTPPDDGQVATPTTPRVASPPDERGDSTLTVVIAFAANLAVALAKSAAAALTGSASMVAEAVHSWADTGNEVFLLVADRSSRRKADAVHPLGYGREAYVWSMFAAIGLFAVGAGVSVTHGIQELAHPEPATDFGVAYAVLALSFVLEGLSFLRSIRQARGEARVAERDVLEHVVATSDPTLRAVVAEDAAALVGLVVAFVGVLAHQLTGSPVPDAIGSIVVGLVLGVVAVILIQRNRVFLVGAGVDERTRRAVLAGLLGLPDVARVTYLRLEYVGPRSLYLVASVDLVGDAVEHVVARRLDALERKVAETPRLAGVVLTLSTPEEPSLTV
ncbi:cation diffusion facilitator family transporter [Luteimicrobium sp. DT211]|uniref:cation diffusion facilitator family transporter n=1 Tax=Luteimicrobium sp. DT211 TaxID=3393412 RepID=UPI003CEBDC64